jgi:hypothetical protein
MSRFSTAVDQAVAEGLGLVNVSGDGACLFRAACYVNSGSQDNHLELRLATVDYMRNNEAFFTDYGDLDPDEKLPFRSYLDKISNPTQQVGEFVLIAIANVLHKPVRVFHGGGPPHVYSPSVNDSAGIESSNYINILFRELSSENNGHYYALVNINHNLSTVNVPNIHVQNEENY